MYTLSDGNFNKFFFNRDQLSATKMPTAMCRWASHAIGIGSAKADIHVFSDAQPCWCSIVVLCAALCHLLRNAIFRPHRLPLKGLPETSSKPLWFVKYIFQYMEFIVYCFLFYFKDDEQVPAVQPKGTFNRN